MKEIAIICLLPKEVNKFYLELRQKIAKQFDFNVNHKVPAHITIKYGFPFEDLGEVERVVQEFCLSQSKTKWELHDFGNFVNPDNRVVFIDAIPSRETRKVHKKFYDDLQKIKWIQWAQYDSVNLHYHITLVSKGITSENYEAVWSFVNQQEKPNFEVYFDNLALFRIENDPPFIYQEYHFPD